MRAENRVEPPKKWLRGFSRTKECSLCGEREREADGEEKMGGRSRGGERVRVTAKINKEKDELLA